MQCLYWSSKNFQCSKKTDQKVSSIEATFKKSLKKEKPKKTKIEGCIMQMSKIEASDCFIEVTCLYVLILANQSGVYVGFLGV